MYARKHIIAPKSVESDTGWKNGNVAKTHVPFLRNKLRLHTPWNWRATHLNGLDSTAYHLLVMYRMDKPNYKAWLSLRVNDKEYGLVCRYECHMSHGGVHAHLLCGEEHYPVNEIEPKGAYRFPQHKRSKQDVLGLISLNEAWQKALKFYRIGVKGDGELL